MSQRLSTAALGLLLLVSASLRAQNDFSDQFERPDGPVDGWTLYSGSWNIQSGQLHSAVGDGWIWAGAPPITLDGDFYLSMNVSFPSIPGDTVGRHGGIMFFAAAPTERNSTSGYTIDWIDRDDDHGFRMIRFSGGSGTVLVSGTPGIAEPPALWEVIVSGDLITVKGDGATVIELSDSTYRQGHFGLWTYSNTEMLFDNIDISNSPGMRACFEATPRSGQAPLEVSFSASCSAGSDEEEIVSHHWDFGDGNTAAGSAAVHTFEAADTYTVTLTVTGSAGGEASTSSAIDVFAENGGSPIDVDSLLGARVKRYGAEADSTVVFNEIMYHPATD
ncbi:MAG: PKD domain-containing protein, partial [Planctomycetes bacterium]|nr:PKD domain-containing protein [Planctomycetota bacterium]